jgi:hypothetical protein
MWRFRREGGERGGGRGGEGRREGEREGGEERGGGRRGRENIPICRASLLSRSVERARVRSSTNQHLCSKLCEIWLLLVLFFFSLFLFFLFSTFDLFVFSTCFILPCGEYLLGVPRSLHFLSFSLFYSLFFI